MSWGIEKRAWGGMQYFSSIYAAAAAAVYCSTRTKTVCTKTRPKSRLPFVFLAQKYKKHAENTKCSSKTRSKSSYFSHFSSYLFKNTITTNKQKIRRAISIFPPKKDGFSNQLQKFSPKISFKCTSYFKWQIWLQVENIPRKKCCKTFLFVCYRHLRPWLGPVPGYILHIPLIYTPSIRPDSDSVYCLNKLSTIASNSIYIRNQLPQICTRLPRCVYLFLSCHIYIFLQIWKAFDMFWWKEMFLFLIQNMKATSETRNECPLTRNLYFPSNFWGKKDIKSHYDDDDGKLKCFQ